MLEKGHVDAVAGEDRRRGVHRHLEADDSEAVHLQLVGFDEADLGQPVADVLPLVALESIRRRSN
jgi:hypothetical protein